MSIKNMHKNRRVKQAVLSVLAAVFAVSGSYSAAGDNTVWADGSRVIPNTVVNQAAPVYYTVQKGDCLWSIAREYDLTVELLADANDLESDSSLSVDEKLFIPAGEEIAYEVKQGDTLWGLARKFHTTVESLVYNNGQDVGDTLPAGRTIVIAATGSEPNDGFGEQEVIVSRRPSWPLTGTVTSVFGMRDGKMHHGLDIAADEGRYIRAVDNGKVIFAGERGPYGNTVMIRHGRGMSSLYAHASKLKVFPGEEVKKGQVIALVGSTGHSTGPHLHLEMRYKGVPQNPEDYLTKDDTKL